MYTLTRKLSVVCLTVVLSFLVYGCGGSSKQALITDVSTDMVTAGLTPDSGTYIIQPDGTATAGDVTFACPAEGSSCEVTVADDGTVTSTGGMATAMTSASAAARVAAVAAATASEADKVAAVAAATASEEARVAAVAAATASEEARVAAVAAATASEEARVAAVAAATASEADKVAAVAAATASEEARVAAVAAATASEADKVAAVAAAMVAEEARVAAVAAATASEADKVAAVAAAMVAEEARLAAVEEARLAEEARVAAVAAATASEADKVAAVAAATASEEARVAAVAAATASEEARVAAVAAATASEADKVAAVAAATASEEARVAAVAAATASEADKVAAVAAATASEEARVAAVAAATASEADKVAAVAAAMVAEEARVAAVAAATASEADKVAAVAAAMVAEEARLAAVEEARLAGIAKDVAEGERDDAQKAAMLAELVRDEALESARLANLRANPNAVDTSTLMSDYMIITAGTYNLEPGKNVDAGDANFACPVNGEPCEVIVDEDGTVVSAGGMATVQNSVAAMTTRTARALFSPDGDGAVAGILITQAQNPDAPATVTAERSPEGVTTITLAHVADEENTIEYASEAVDTGHDIPGWMGQTLTRDDGVEAMMDEEAVPATWMNEATVYTNIDPAMRGKLMYEGTENPIPGITTIRIEVEADQMYGSDDGDTFMGAFIRTDGTRIPGTFTCDADEDGCTAIVGTETVVGTLVLSANPSEGWEFESDNNVTEGETQDTNYMYFGYWLNSPVDSLAYEFATYSGGNQDFAIDTLLSDDSHALTATYEGGAAGRYVTRELRVINGIVDQFSPGFHGRFTAKAALTADFGSHADFNVDVDMNPLTVDVVNMGNMVEGTITEFMDGDTELGFEVTLSRTAIGDNSNTPQGISGDTSAMFGNPGDNTGTGDWTAQFFGANADGEATPSVKGRTLPSGIAGRFDAGSNYTKVVGAFAAEKQ